MNYLLPESIRTKPTSTWTIEDKLEWCYWVLERRIERGDDTTHIIKTIEKLEHDKTTQPSNT